MRGVLRRVLRTLAWLVFAAATGSALLVLVFRWVPPPTSAFVLARRVEAWTGAAPAVSIRREWVPRERIAPQLFLAVVAAEDQRFPRHHGFDFTEISRALAERDDGRVRGASTLSQQVAKNLFLWSGRSWVRKGLEAWFTVLIEASWPKGRILEVYVNFAEFGDGVYGAEAAAQHFFRRDAAQLGTAEAARLAAVLPNPREYNAARPGPWVRARQRWIETQMRQLGGTAYVAPLLEE